jgi:hypothetical protein
MGEKLVRDFDHHLHTVEVSRATCKSLAIGIAAMPDTRDLYPFIPHRIEENAILPQRSRSPASGGWSFFTSPARVPR